MIGALEREMLAVRLGVSLSEPEHMVPLRITGDDAFDALDALCPADLFVRDGQMLHTLLLDESARPLVDVYVCRDDEDFILLTEGLPAPTLVEHIGRNLPAGLSPGIERLDQTHRLLSLNGPWAWELMSELVGPGVVGLPYLSFYHEERWTCFRGGKTGEFGYDLLVAQDHAEPLEGELLALGAAMDIRRVGQQTLDQCALENWFFNIRREGSAGVSPIELQLQWRVSYQKDYLGARALRALRQAGPQTRLTGVVSEGKLATGDTVLFEERPVGELVNADYSSTRRDWVGLALLELKYAHSGLDCFAVPDRQPIRTVSPPVINNRSMFINQQKHSYQTRDEHEFPPLVRRPK